MKESWYKNKRRSHTALLSVKVADIKLSEQITNLFYTKTKIDKNHLDGDLVETIRAECFRDKSVWKSIY